MCIKRLEHVLLLLDLSFVKVKVTSKFMEEFAVIIDSSCSRQLMIDQEHIFNSCINHVLINHVHAINYGQ